jgi:hypothetical protein
MSNDGRFQEGNKAAWQHGQGGQFSRSGGADDTALTETQHRRLVEIGAQLETPEGMIEALRDKAASLALIVEWGQAWLRDKAERGRRGGL